MGELYVMENNSAIVISSLLFVVVLSFTLIAVLFYKLSLKKQELEKSANLHSFVEVLASSNVANGHLIVALEGFSLGQLSSLKKHIERHMGLYADKMYELDDISYLQSQVAVLRGYVDIIDEKISEG
jgi:hypothetical protein